MTCNRLSMGALALTLAVFAAGLALTYSAMTTTFERAASARHSLRATVSAGVTLSHLPPGLDRVSS